MSKKTPFIRTRKNKLMTKNSDQPKQTSTIQQATIQQRERDAFSKDFKQRVGTKHDESNKGKRNESSALVYMSKTDDGKFLYQWLIC